MSGNAKAKLGSFNHTSIPVRDLEEAKRFYSEVLGGENVRDLALGFAEVTLGGATIGLSQQKSGWTGRDAEYPHYAFTMDPDDFYPFIKNLKAHGVPTHEPWTRHGIEALMYFRDPSGNLMEIYCPKGLKGVDKLPRSVKAGGNMTIDFAALNYEWKG
ncbi:MAG TPA: VOC family protein [Candidatus Binatia bacterium]